MPELKWNYSEHKERKREIWVGEITVDGKVIRDVTLLLSDEELAMFESEAEECGINLDVYLRLVAVSRLKGE